jgi:hypothetical protein
MAMDVENGLTRSFVAIDYQAVAVFAYTFFCGNFLCGKNNFAQQFGIFFCSVIYRGDGLFGYNEYMHGRLGIDVAESEHPVVFIYNISGNFFVDYFGKNCVSHSKPFCIIKSSPPLSGQGANFMTFQIII